MNVNNFFVNTNDYFESFKKVLFEKFISYYGEQYRNIIIDRINSCYIDFSSSPIEDYNYAFFNCNTSLIDKEIIELIRKRYLTYKKISDDIKEVLNQKYLDFLLNEIKVGNYDNIHKNIDCFLNMFTLGEFGKIYIDGFTIDSNNILNNLETPTKIKKSIFSNRKNFNNDNTEFAFGLKKPSYFLAYKTIEFRKKIHEEYEMLLAQKSEFGQNILEKTENLHHIELSADTLAYITFAPTACCNNIIVSETDEEIEWYSCIRVPLTLLLNRGISALDTNIIHELIHCIETLYPFVGIELYSENTIANEIRTQKLAMEITEELHKEGVYIFNNPQYKQLYRESAYERLFPISFDFFNKYEDIFKDCAIRNDRLLLIASFGKSWPIYSKYLDDIFNKSIDTPINIEFDNTYCDLISDMEHFYNSKDCSHKRKVYTYKKN